MSATDANEAPATPSSQVEAIGEPASRDRHPWRWPRNVARGALGLLVGLAVTEGVFRYRDESAFPLVNVYASDAECGVRLEPMTTTRVGRPGERIITVRVNREGFRGPEWSDSSSDDVLVVGDSQSFGLGVEESEAFPARLSVDLSKNGAEVAVLDASVPTYGPPEYDVIEERVLSRRTPGTVVVSLNLLNDFFELDRPNRERHGAYDGWAVRTGSTTTKTSASPLIEPAIQRSHLAFAFWRWREERSLDPATMDRELDAHDLANLVTNAEQEVSEATASAERARQQHAADTRAELVAAKAEIAAYVGKYRFMVSTVSTWSNEWREYARSRGEPNDQLFTISYGGCEAAYGTYDSFFEAHRIREEVESTLKEFSKLPGMPREDARAIFAAIDRRDAAERAVANLPKAPPPAAAAHPAVAMTRWLEAFRQHTPPTVRVVALAIPMDVQVAPRAREVSGVSDAESQALDRLVADLALSAKDLGVMVVDPTSALRELGDGAYLAGGHLSPEGHRAVADALASTIGS